MKTVTRETAGVGKKRGRLQRNHHPHYTHLGTHYLG